MAVPASPVTGPFSYIGRLATLIGLSPQRRRYGTPHHLSAYMLKDIGITHDDLGVRQHSR